MQLGWRQGDEVFELLVNLCLFGGLDTDYAGQEARFARTTMPHLTDIRNHLMIGTDSQSFMLRESNQVFRRWKSQKQTCSQCIHSRSTTRLKNGSETWRNLLFKTHQTFSFAPAQKLSLGFLILGTTFSQLRFLVAGNKQEKTSRMSFPQQLKQCWLNSSIVLRSIKAAENDGLNCCLTVSTKAKLYDLFRGFNNCGMELF